MNKMVEQVARAICIADGRDPDSAHADGTKSEWHLYSKSARAAITAMREPMISKINAMIDRALD